MITLQYRARLIDPGNANSERPLEIFGSDRKEIDEWAEKVLAKAVSERAAVMIWQTIETQVGLIPKPRPEKKA
jgi:hypothetical protein